MNMNFINKTFFGITENDQQTIITPAYKGRAFGSPIDVYTHESKAYTKYYAENPSAKKYDHVYYIAVPFQYRMVELETTPNVDILKKVIVRIPDVMLSDGPKFSMIAYFVIATNDDKQSQMKFTSTKLNRNIASLISECEQNEFSLKTRTVTCVVGGTNPTTEFSTIKEKMVDKLFPIKTAEQFARGIVIKHTLKTL